MKILFNHPNVQKYFSEPVSCQSVHPHITELTHKTQRNCTLPNPSIENAYVSLLLVTDHIKVRLVLNADAQYWHFLGTHTMRLLLFLHQSF